MDQKPAPDELSLEALPVASVSSESSVQAATSAPSAPPPSLPSLAGMQAGAGWPAAGATGAGARPVGAGGRGQGGLTGLFSPLGVGFAVAAPVALGLMILLAFGSPSASGEAMSRLAGYLLAGTLICVAAGCGLASIARLAGAVEMEGKGGRGTRWLLRAVFCVGVAAIFVGASLHWQRFFVSSETRAAQDLLRDMKKAVDDPSAMLAPGGTGGGSAVAGGSGGEMQFVANCVRQMLAEVQQAAETYQQQLRDTGVETVLQPEKLLSAESIKSGKQTMVRCIEIRNQYEKKSRQVIDGFVARISSMNVSPALKQGIAQGYRQTQAATMRRLKGIMDCQRASDQDAIELLDFMQEKLGTVELRDDKLIFATTEDAKTYNQFLARMEQRQAQLEQLVAQNADVARRALGDMEKALEKK